jgi:hypothetical protein
VGRNLQGHHYTGAMGFFDFDTYDDVGPGASIAISDYNHGTPGLCGGGMLANEFIRLPIHMVDRLPKARRAGASAQAGHARWHKRNIVIMGPTQQIPTADARVTLDPTVRDKWGLPVARISGNVHPTPSRSACAGQRAEAWLKEAGASARHQRRQAGPFLPASTRPAPAAWATIPKLGREPQLPDSRRRQCLRHRLSVHVTNGGFNPALTIMAIAYYGLCALVRNWKGTGFRS